MAYVSRLDCYRPAKLVFETLRECGKVDIFDDTLFPINVTACIHQFMHAHLQLCQVNEPLMFA
jgi:hypothetical protein